MYNKNYNSALASLQRWRKKNSSTARTPERIKAKLVRYIGKYSVAKISRDTELSQGTLRRWRDSPLIKEKKAKPSKQRPASKSSFVEVTTDLPNMDAAQTKIEVSKPSGEKISFSGNLTPEIAAAMTTAFLAGKMLN